MILAKGVPVGAASMSTGLLKLSLSFIDSYALMKSSAIPTLFSIKLSMRLLNIFSNECFKQAEVRRGR